MVKTRAREWIRPKQTGGRTWCKLIRNPSHLSLSASGAFAITSHFTSPDDPVALFAGDFLLCAAQIASGEYDYVLLRFVCDHLSPDGRVERVSEEVLWNDAYTAMDEGIIPKIRNNSAFRSAAYRAAVYCARFYIAKAKTASIAAAKAIPAPTAETARRRVNKYLLHGGKPAAAAQPVSSTAVPSAAGEPEIVLELPPEAVPPYEESDIAPEGLIVEDEFA